LGGFDPNQLNLPDWAFGLVLLREQGGREQQQKRPEPVELLHGYLLSFA